MKSTCKFSCSCHKSLLGSKMYGSLCGVCGCEKLSEGWEKEFAQIHYEPEHEQNGGFCWCNPNKIARGGRLEIDHIPQRKILIDFIKTLLLPPPL